MANIDKEGQITKGFQDTTQSGTDVNILLLGETGVGKSTLINAFTNYLEYENFDIAEKGEVRCLIPTKFVVMNEDFEQKVIEIGKDDNENNTMTESATLETRSYVFPINKKGIHRIRLIDTPGIGDPRGIARDDENMENILSYISHIESLHAICFLLKPNNVRLTVIFHYCIKRLLSRLEKSASKNIIFLFTNTRSTFYQPGDSIIPLRAILKDIKNKPPFADIKIVRDNVFCLDNESFRYLVAVKSGVELGDRRNFVESWKQSAEECWRMLQYISGQANSNLTPHKVKDTVSVNNARRIILQLSQPLADIADLINDNINTLKWQNHIMQRDSLSIVDLKKNLYVPVINLRCKELSQPITVCTDKRCIEIYTVNNIKKYHYKQICHDPCYLRNVPREHIGSPELINCKAMSNHKCKICNCSYRSHMHIYYTTETYEDQIDNEGVEAQIKDREAAINIKKTLIANIESRKANYEKEMVTIIKTMAKFAYFLQRNLISPYNDAYKGYIEYLIDREFSLSKHPDFEMIEYYNDLLQRYTKEKQILDGLTVTAADVFDSVQALYELRHTGAQIKNLHSWIVRNQNNEHTNTEFVLKTSEQQVIKKKQDTGNKNNNSKQNQRKDVKNRIKTNNQPNMKVKKRKSDSKEQNVDQQNFEEHRTRQQRIHDLVDKDMPNYVTKQDHIFQQGLQQNNNIHQLMYSNCLPNSGHFQNFSPQHGNVLNQDIELPPPISYINYVNIKSNTNSLNTNDSNFDKYYKDTGSSNDPPKNSNTSGHLMCDSNLLKIEESSDDEFSSNQDVSCSPVVAVDTSLLNFQQDQPQSSNLHFGRKQINSNSLSMFPNHERDLNEPMNRHKPKHSVKPCYSPEVTDDVKKNKQRDSKQKRKSRQNNSDLVKPENSNNCKSRWNKYCNII